MSNWCMGCSKEIADGDYCEGCQANFQVNADGKKKLFHTHICKWCRQPYECGNGPECELGKVDGHCSQECYDHKRK